MRVKLWAYFAQNLGDDLMVELLLNRYPDCEFYAWYPVALKSKKMKRSNLCDILDLWKKYGRLNHILNCLTGKRKTDAFINGKLRKYENGCDCAVVIGGSIYPQIDNESLEKRMELERQKGVPNKDLFVIGANFGPYKDEFFWEQFRQYFGMCSDVCFRDSKSHELFQDVPSVHWAPDVVFNVPLGKIGNNGNVPISVIELERRPTLSGYSRQYYEKIAQICQQTIRKGKRPVLTSFCQKEGDELAIEKIEALIDPKYRGSVERYFYRGDTEEALELFRNADSVVATRFHAMILGMRFSKPLFSISYNLKMENVLRDTNSVDWCDIREIGNISAENILKSEKNIVEIESMVRRSAEQFRQLDMFLAKRANNVL